MGLKVVQGNIATARTTAIVNAANSGLWEGAGVCGAIFGEVKKAGGHSELTIACQAIGHCDEGSAVITPSFGLPADFIIHAVGPKWAPAHQLPHALSDRQKMSAQLLVNAYRSILSICRENGIKSVSIPAISTGIFGFPKALAAAIATHICAAESGDISVDLVAFGAEDFNILITPPATKIASHLAELGL